MKKRLLPLLLALALLFSFSTRLRVWAWTFAGIVATHYAYGWNFLRGLFGKARRRVEARAHRGPAQRQAAERGHMSVVAAFMGYPFVYGTVRQGNTLIHRQRIHIRPESDR